jgi:DNA helicase II / ATP-dependent DNA helicase PcrA
VHKSKGLENDRVFILRPDKLPLKGCMKVLWMAEQEMNLQYVAYTRAKHYLGFILDFE